MRADLISKILEELNIYAMIPARGGSKRLPKKNIYPFLGKPMMSYAIGACQKSKYIKKIVVSTENNEVAEVANNFDVEVLKRPDELAGDFVITQDVMKHFAQSFPEMNVLVLVQANSPGVKTENIDKAIELLVKHNLREVRSVDDAGLENGAFWIVTRTTIDWPGLSVYFGVVKELSIDVHTLEDLKMAEKQFLLS